MLLWTTASGSGQAALVQQKAIAGPAAAGAFNAAGVGTGTRVIGGVWQFHLGDDLNWAQPGLDDSGWQQLPPDKSLGTDGQPVYYGFAWYRRQIALDPTDKNPLALYLPDEGTPTDVYWNGVKVGGIDKMPPHPICYYTEMPVAIPLPSSPGAGSATLAIRTWVMNDVDAFSAPLQLGYAPLIQQMPEQWVEHRLRSLLASNYAPAFLMIFVGLAAMILWLRWRSQWILLCAGTYLIFTAVQNILAWGSFSLGVSATIVFENSFDWIEHLAFLFLILLLADLPDRPGIRGFRFWKRVCLASSACVLLGELALDWRVLLLIRPPSALFHFLHGLPDFRDYAESLSLMLVLIASLVLGKLRLPRLLFMVAAAVQVFIYDMTGFVTWYPRLIWLLSFGSKPLFEIYGSSVTFFTLSSLLLLATIVYAVWDHLSGQLAEQRRVSSELKAAQEVQKILVAAEERGAPGYAVASVYRPASEVGGDFFQVIPLEGDATLIVAGDVSGKGLRAAMTVSLIVGAVRTLAEQDSSPAAVLAGLNRRLIGRTQGGFATCCAMRIDPTGDAILANAGHCQPYLDEHEVELPPGLPLGLVEGVTYDEVSLAISPGQQLTLMSDGVVEARNDHGELYGFERLGQLMRERPKAEHVANTAVDFGQDDDITVLTVTRLTAEPNPAIQFSDLSPAPA